MGTLAIGKFAPTASTADLPAAAFDEDGRFLAGTPSRCRFRRADQQVGYTDQDHFHLTRMTTREHYSLVQVASGVFTDQAAGAPLEAHAYLFNHVDGSWTAQLEIVDPDAFPSSSPRYASLGELDGQAIAPSRAPLWMQEQARQWLADKLPGRYAFQADSPRKPTITPLRNDLEIRVTTSEFWGKLWASVGMSVEGAVCPMASDMENDAAVAYALSLGPLNTKLRDALAYILSHNALDLQDGVDDLCQVLASNPSKVAHMLPPRVHAYLRSLIMNAAAKTKFAPMAFTSEDLVAHLGSHAQGLLHHRAMTAGLTVAPPVFT